MKNYNHLVGKRYGKWTVLAEAGRISRYVASLLLICECGTTRCARLSDLRCEKSNGCGCDRKTNETHGMSKTPEHRTWLSMKERCYNRSCKEFRWYGKRGIKVCNRWLDSFENFYKDMGPRPKGMSIDRINVDGDYSPKNCRWATQKQQMNNTQRTTWINGKSLGETARELNIKPNTLLCRIKRHGYSLDDAVKIPVIRGRPAGRLIRNHPTKS